MKVLLCLLSEQHVPNLLSVHHYKPDRLVLIESDGMRQKKVAEYFLDALAIANFPLEQVDILPLEDENNLASVRRCLHHAFSKFPQSEWIANVTGGLKPMSIAAYEFFKALGSPVVYIDSRNPNELLGLDGALPESSSYVLSLAEFMAGYGFKISKSWAKIIEGEERARKWWPAARAVAEFAPDKNLLQVSADASGREEWETARKKGITLESRHCDHLPIEVKTSLSECWKLQGNGTTIAGKIDKYQGTFLTGGWLEVFFWKLLTDHAASLGLEHIHLGVEALRKGSDAPTDFDVAFMKRQALGAIECKSGSQEQGDDPNTPLDKLEARIKQFRALRVNPILATTSAKILDESGSLKSTFAARSEIYNCRVITTTQIRKLAKRPDSLENVRLILFGIPLEK